MHSWQLDAAIQVELKRSVVVLHTRLMLAMLVNLVLF